MQDILCNKFKQELIVYVITEPDTGHVAVNCSMIRKCIQEGKKVLFYSLEQPKDIMLRRIKLIDTINLLIKDKQLVSLEEISKNIDSFKADIVIIDYFWLLINETKTEDMFVLNRIAKEKNIPFIIVIPLVNNNNQVIDYCDITLEEFKKNNESISTIIQIADRFILFYKKSSKEYVARELLNNFTLEPKEFDIRDLLN